MEDMNYTPRPTDLSAVEQTPLVKAFSDFLARYLYEQTTMSAPRTFLSPTPWESLSEESRNKFLEDGRTWAEFLEARYSLDGIFGGDMIPPDYLHESLAREVHERKASELISEGWVYGESTDAEKRTSPSLVDYDSLPFTEKMECERIADYVDSCMFEFNEIYARGVETVDDILHSAQPRYNVSYGIADSALESVLNELEARVGWKGAERHYNFAGVSGFYLKRSEGGWELKHGSMTDLRFFPTPEGGLGMTVCSEAFRQYDNVHPMSVVTDLKAGSFCLDESNISILREETHYGHEVVFGLRYGESAAFCIPKDASGREDINLMRLLAEREKNIRIVSPQLFSDSLAAWVDEKVKVGFEPAQRPVIVRYAYNGETLFSEREKDLESKRIIAPGLASDWVLIDGLLEGGEKIRQEFQHECGVDSARYFLFEDAYFPSPLVVDDTLFLCRDCGNEYPGFLSVIRGKVCYFKTDENPDGLISADSKPERVFSSVREALNFVRSFVMTKENIMRGRAEYSTYKYSKGQGQHKH